VIQDHYRALDLSAAVFAGLAAFSFWQGIALAVTIIAGLLSIALAGIRLHDRVRYGPVK
jgi:hypothetical protein